jgi:hypothetical protein
MPSDPILFGHYERNLDAHIRSIEVIFIVVGLLDVCLW